MIVFKTFLKVLNKCKLPIILYTVILIAFGGLNMQTSDANQDFISSKPDVVIINKDEEKGLTKNLISYIKEYTNVIDIREDEDVINDALFYRQVNYVIYIPKNYRKDTLSGKNPQIEIKSSGDYNASLANMLLENYLQVTNVYSFLTTDEDTLIHNINEAVKKTMTVEMTSSLDTDHLNKATFYYNFLNYSVLAGSIYVICLILSIFHEEKIKKRTIIGSMNYRKQNLILLLSNLGFAIVLWLIYIIISIILCGKIMFTSYGLFYMINSLLFTCCSVAIAFLLSNLIQNKNAINGIVNIVALGSSFLCGAFVPTEFLPSSVLSFAHVLPSYWYINTNERLKGIESISIETLQPILVNMLALIGFSVLFVVLSIIVSKRKRKVA